MLRGFYFVLFFFFVLVWELKSEAQRESSMALDLLSSVCCLCSVAFLPTFHHLISLIQTQAGPFLLIQRASTDRSEHYFHFSQVSMLVLFLLREKMIRILLISNLCMLKDSN